MPLFEYECSGCHTIFEVLMGPSDAPPGECATCGHPVERMLSAPSLNLGHYGGPTEAKYARVSDSEEVEREKKLQRGYERLRFPPGVKHNPWD